LLPDFVSSFQPPNPGRRAYGLGFRDTGTLPPEDRGGGGSCWAGMASGSCSHGSGTC